MQEIVTKNATQTIAQVQSAASAAGLSGTTVSRIDGVSTYCQSNCGETVTEEATDYTLMIVSLVAGVVIVGLVVGMFYFWMKSKLMAAKVVPEGTITADGMLPTMGSMVSIHPMVEHEKPDEAAAPGEDHEPAEISVEDGNSPSLDQVAALFQTVCGGNYYATTSQVTEMCQSLGIYYSLRKHQNLVRRLDPHNTGKVSMGAFMSWIHRRQAKKSEIENET